MKNSINALAICFIIIVNFYTVTVTANELSVASIIMNDIHDNSRDNNKKFADKLAPRDKSPVSRISKGGCCARVHNVCITWCNRSTGCTGNADCNVNKKSN